MIRPVAVIDFGGQYAHLIANRIRRLSAYSEIFENDVPAEELRKKNIAGIILSGGPHSVYDPEGPSIDPKILGLGVPVLGICYGHQLIAQVLHGSVKRGKVKEYGKSVLRPIRREGVFKDFPEKSVAWMSHGDTVEKLPSGFEIIAETDDCPVAGMADFSRNIFGVQFHPEVTHTEKGMLLLANFIRLAGVENTWKIDDYLEQSLQKIRDQAEGKKVFLLVSGGVDSSVSFALLEKALGKERIYGLFVDHGLMRKDEAAEVKVMLEEAGFPDLHIADESGRFLPRLAGVTDPEMKRKIIGDTFIDVQERISERLNLDPEKWLLGQGTIYPDTIESGGTKHADKIKTHHNRVEKIKRLMELGKIIEPLKDLYKDEVRELGRKLGLPEKMISRHPFPGPGLAVRILCTEKADILPNEGEIEKQIEIQFPGISAKILPVKSVGVQGDGRSYRHPVVLFPTKEFSWEEFDAIATAIPNIIPEINRVLLCVSSEQKISSMSVPKSDLSSLRIRILQEADAVVRNILEEENWEGK